MDYCYACRRHLNGAYSCPGCGTPADQLALPAVTDTAVLPPVGDDPDAPGGRASRRADGRRSASRRARRGRQRAAVYGVGAIAVVGALTMFSMAALSGGGKGGSDPGVGVNPVLPGSSSAAASPDDAGLFPSGSPTPGHHGGSPSGSASPSASASATATTKAPQTTAPATTAPPTPTKTHHTPKPTATTTQPPSSPTPTTTPCKKVLWWCQ